MTILGYAVILAYIFALIFALGPIVKKYTNLETSRKAIHICLFAVWVLLDLFFKGTVHQIIIPVLFIVLNLLSYRFGIYKSVERDSGNHLGTVYFAIAMTVLLTLTYFFPALYECGGIAVFCLTFGDGFAAMIGYNFPSRKLYHSKSLLGFCACVLAAWCSCWIFCRVYGLSLPPWQLLLIALTAAVAELNDYGLDNFTVTFAAFGLAAVYTLGAPERFTFSYVWALGVFFAVFLAKTIDFYGSLSALFMVFVFSFWGGNAMLTFLLCSYAAIALISVVKSRVLHRKKEHGRRAVQILINGGLGTLAVILSHLLQNPGFLAVAVISIGGCFVDSLSSDVGVLSRSQPFDPLKRKRVPAGLSGGMTVLGTGAALAGTLVIAGTTARFLALTPGKALLLGILIFAQTLLDTVLGSAIQVKYRCAVCGALTEKKEHCGGPSIYDSGIPFVDNNLVNLLSSLVITLLAAALFAR